MVFAIIVAIVLALDCLSVPRILSGGNIDNLLPLVVVFLVVVVVVVVVVAVAFLFVVVVIWQPSEVSAPQHCDSDIRGNSEMMGGGGRGKR